MSPQTLYQSQHYKGTEDFDPTCLYAATKQAFESIIDYYAVIGKVSAVTLKLFDVYGPEDTRKKIFQLLFQASMNNQLLKMSPGGQLLNFIYIDDVISAYVCGIDYLKKKKHIEHKKYFVGSENFYTLKDAVKLYQSILGENINVQWGGKPYRKREVMRPICGNKLPGWLPNTNLVEGLETMVAFQKREQYVSENK